MELISTRHVVSSFLSTYRVYKFPNIQTNLQALMLHSSFREAKQGGSLTSFEEEEQVPGLPFSQPQIFYIYDDEGIFSMTYDLYNILQRHIGDFFSAPDSYSQGLQLYNISEDPTESRNLVRWMNPARLELSLPNNLCSAGFRCLCRYALALITSTFVLLAQTSRTDKHEQSSSPRQEIIRRLQDLAIDHYR